ncbi:MAG: DegT/DnrJ/EryC1/StrS family aminotransferase [Polyangiaceae bacterium]
MLWLEFIDLPLLETATCLVRRALLATTRAEFGHEATVTGESNMTDSDYVVFGRPHFSEEEIGEVAAVLRGGWVGTGPKTKEFERRFSQYIGTTHAVAVGSCTAALHLAMTAAGIREGDEVITTPLTFAATANAIIHAGATPVFADVDPITQNIDPEQVEEKISARTRAILVVHLAGRPCNMDALSRIAHRYGIMLFEDAAHAIEARYKGRKVGALADASCFSFYVTKNISTIEGGMLCTSHEVLANKAAILGTPRDDVGCLGSIQ